MTSRDFAFWLQGFFEISGESLTTMPAEQVAMVKKHLALVFVHEIDPSHGGPDEQAKLNAIHNVIEPTGFEKIQAHNAEAAKTEAPLMRC